ncbi:MAG: UDP-N-acetylmuramate--L-alanine ligase [Candidatus Cryptobacteroides sp.]
MQKIYFIGIGGIGMSAIARYYKFKGYEVSGYDRTPSELTRQLEQEGIAIHYEDRPELLPEDKEQSLIIYTPAIPNELQELVKARNEGYRLLKRSQVLGELTRGERTLAVAGTHGKTTTSSLIAHILESSGVGCNAFLGGISLNYGTNYLFNANSLVVVEADEFDRSFLQLHPQISVITAMDADHLDIYGTLENMQQAYRDYAAQVEEGIVAKLGLPLEQKDFKAHIYSYHIEDDMADFHAADMRVLEDGHYVFDLVHPKGLIKDIRVGALGRLNVENSVAAAAVCLLQGVEEEQIRKGIGTFKGVKRRLEEHLNSKKLTYIDDYAHHPAEIRAALSSIRAMFPQRKLTAIFQPHLYSRTRDFAAEFAEALSLADQAVLLDIYPARELPIEGVSSELIFKDIHCEEKQLLGYGELLDWLKKQELDVVVSLGAGNIDRLVQPITELLKERI